MYGKDKFYFLIDNIKSNFSFYGNNTTWSGKVVDQNDNIVNKFFSITTCEEGMDIEDEIHLACADDAELYGKVFNKNGEIIDSQKYGEMVERIWQKYIDCYWKMDADSSEYKEVEGRNCKKIAIGDFVKNHTIGHVGEFCAIRNSYDDFNTVEGIMLFKEDFGSYVDFGKWSANYIYVCGFILDDNCSDHIKGMIETLVGRTYPMSYYGPKDEGSQKKLKTLKPEEFYEALNDMILEACNNFVSLPELVAKHNVTFES